MWTQKGKSPLYIVIDKNNYNEKATEIYCLYITN